MKVAWLIGRTFMREQRIVLYVFLGWVVFFGALFTLLHRPGEGPEDLEMLYRQQATYGVLFALFTAASAIHTERRSRRIIGVLSKGIYRLEYLAGLQLGIMLLTGIYFLALAAVNHYFIERFAFPGEAWTAAGALWIASALGCALALMFGTFMPPFVAMFASTLVLAVPHGLSVVLGDKAALLIPVAYVMRKTYDFTFEAGWQGGSAFLWIALAETLLFLGVAAMIFERKDVTLAVD